MSHHDIKRKDEGRRDFVEPAPSRRPARTELAGWGVPLAIAAFVFVAGMLLFSFAAPEHMRTATNTQPPPVSMSAPSAEPQTPAAEPQTRAAEAGKQ